MAARLTFTRHALEMLQEREIDADWIGRAIEYPDVTERDANYPDRINVLKALPERNGKVLRVIYIDTGTERRVITAFLDRRRRTQ